MEIIASKKALYNLLAFICLKMERNKIKSPMGSVLSSISNHSLRQPKN